MSKNASSDFDELQISDNPQEMLKKNFYFDERAVNEQYSVHSTRAKSNYKSGNRCFYFSGLCAAEMSCSIIKVTNHNPADHFYYVVDLTVTNADKELLKEVNQSVMKNQGIITSVKGAYNLSVRGKNKTRIALDFLEKYPILVGDLAKNRIIILKTALAYLDTHRTYRLQKEKIEKMEELRKKLREIKTEGIVDQVFDTQFSDAMSLGYFFAGVIDGEGSFGTKKSGKNAQPFFAIAMKDRKIIESLNKFVSYGNVRLRKDGVYHLEINHREILKNICEMFLILYPLRHKRQKERLEKLQQLLNDYTPRSLKPIWHREYDIV